ncbi:hypothetical protein [Flavobacterium caeni]|uniref:Uncharacterized protein n=1 Tax=Flavobacterium caeni TaxID=490189 RepID=A0A1G5KNX5_9FLAO|nr:hypothetical protein [Flavobacterium caeni]SCZ01798.1 hypothetical protein SAMN02927903_03388 [Flavobacterium caeni]
MKTENESNIEDQIRDSILSFHFQNFNQIIKKKYNGELTPDVEDLINEIKEKLKNASNDESENYTEYCHYLDKAFDDYLESKR